MKKILSLILCAVMLWVAAPLTFAVSDTNNGDANATREQALIIATRMVENLK